MKPIRLFSALMVLSACILVSPTSNAADIKETARATAQKYQKAVVTVRLVAKIKVSMMGQNQDQEQKIEATGTVIDPSGLTVTDATSIDPSSMAKSVLGVLGGMGLKLDSEIKETAILLEDGTEVEADVVLKDTELGLVFVRPRDASRKFDAVTLKTRNVQPQLLDSVFVVGRLGKNANRAAALSFDTIRAIVKGPRSFFVCDKETQSNLGCIAFSADGEPLGVYVMKPKPQAAGEEGGSAAGLAALTRMGEMKDALMPIIRPVNDVMEIAEQAKKAKIPEKRTGAQEKPE